MPRDFASNSTSEGVRISVGIPVTTCFSDNNHMRNNAHTQEHFCTISILNNIHIMFDMDSSQQTARDYIFKVQSVKSWTTTMIATKSGLAASTLNRFMNQSDWKHTLSARSLDKIAGASGIPWREDSANNVALPPSVVELPQRVDMAKDILVMGTAAGSSGEGAFQLDPGHIDVVRRPPGISGAQDIYALYVVGDSMEPKYDEGELVFVSERRPVRIGDHVVVQVENGDGGRSYIKKLLKRTAATLVLQQYNPGRELKIPMKNVRAIHRVLDMNELFGV